MGVQLAECRVQKGFARLYDVSDLIVHNIPRFDYIGAEELRSNMCFVCPLWASNICLGILGSGSEIQISVQPRFAEDGDTDGLVAMVLEECLLLQESE